MELAEDVFLENGYSILKNVMHFWVHSAIFLHIWLAFLSHELYFDVLLVLLLGKLKQLDEAPFFLLLNPFLILLYAVIVLQDIIVALSHLLFPVLDYLPLDIKEGWLAFLYLYQHFTLQLVNFNFGSIVLSLQTFQIVFKHIRECLDGLSQSCEFMLIFVYFL